jgi:hypothetical protein
MRIRPAGKADKSAMRALSIRQPYAELILRGIKPIEFRSRPTRIICERVYYCASQKWTADGGRNVGSSKNGS